MADASWFQDIHVYYLAVVAYFGIFLFGYDTGIAGGVVTQKAFKDEFLGLNPSASAVTAVSSNVVSVLQAGAFFGAIGSAYFSDLLGRRWSLISFCTIFLLGAILQTIAGGSRGLGYIYAGRVIAGIGVGAISAVAPAYVSECSPKAIRGRVTGLFQVLVATGVMISYFLNYGVNKHHPTGPLVWRIAFGFQIVPAGIMAFGLLFAIESPRWLATKGRADQARRNLARLRRRAINSDEIVAEMAEIEASIEEERVARASLGWKEAFTGKGNWIRFLIAFMMFFLQQWSGQNSVSYYAPLIFQAIGYSSVSSSLLASGVYGIMKVVATAIFIWYGVDRFGRRWSLFVSAMGMGILFYMVGAILKTHPTHPPVPGQPNTVSKASQGMAALLYIYVCFYSFGWGPVTWIYISDIFPTATRHYGLSLAASTQWLFNFVVAKITPTLEAKLGWKLFMMFGTINLLGMAVFSYLLPETSGKSLEEMDIIFGAVSAEERRKDIAKAQRALHGDNHSEHDEKQRHSSHSANSA